MVRKVILATVSGSCLSGLSAPPTVIDAFDRLKGAFHIGDAVLASHTFDLEL
jgi:hypothetical protein